MTHIDKMKLRKMGNFLEIGKTGLMTLYINGKRAELVYIPIFGEGDSEAVVTYTFGEPGVDAQFDDVVPIVKL